MCQHSDAHFVTLQLLVVNFALDQRSRPAGLEARFGFIKFVIGSSHDEDCAAVA